MRPLYVLLFCFVIFTALDCVIGTYLFTRNIYYLKAILTVPDANIIEPYEVWVNKNTSSLRVDYYDGTVKLYKKLNQGVLQYFKIHPETTEAYTNKKVCHKEEQTAETKMYEINSYLPVKNFRFVRKEKLNGVEAEKWEHSVLFLPSYNTTIVYTMWIRRESSSPVPLRYEYQMKFGNNVLDNFRHDYILYNGTFAGNDAFEIPMDLKCKVLRETLDHEPVDPLLEFIEPELEYFRVKAAFDRFKLKHNKVYENDDVHMKRMSVFKNNLRFINSLNRQHRSFSVAVNHLADLTDDELSVFSSTLHRNVQKMGADNNKVLKLGENEDIESIFDYDYDDYDSDTDDYLDNLNVSFDWRNYNAITSVKDQTTLCGSCYAFTTAAAIESSAYIARGCKHLEEVSEQALVDCTWSTNPYRGNLGCNGGTYEYTLNWIKGHGVPLKMEYGPYLAMEGFCHMSNMTRLIMIQNSDELLKKTSVIKEAIRTHGPLLAAINNVPKSFTFYSKGIYDDSRCRSEPEERTHGITIVGYGKYLNQKYWILKNTYGPAWGENGYMRISAKYNICGVKNYARSVSFANNKANECFSRK